MKPVKIVATLGPATHSLEELLELAQAGVDVFRINLSHADPTDVTERIGWIREAEHKLGRPFAVMGDLAGPKIRISDMQPDIVLEKGQNFIISKDIEIGDIHGCGLNHPSIVDVLEPGAEVFIDDGTIKLVVTKKLENSVETSILVGGLLKPRKGFSAEGISLTVNDVSEKDKIGIKLMLENHADALAISFVQSPDDVEAVRRMLPPETKMMLIAKIETANGVANADKIVEVSDGIMVARGDLGLAVPLAQIPYIQKQLIDLCVKRSKPVITATQMLESMITKPMPTRAEVTDVANAILDRTDAVMLSAETAAGSFPVETVETMVKIIHEAVKRIEPYEYKEKNTVGNAISNSAGRIADQVGAKLILAFTLSGITARRISRHRHPQSIIAVCSDPAIIRRLNFSWGVYPHLSHQSTSFDQMLSQARELAISNRVLQLDEDDLYVISAGIPFNQAGSTNMVLVQKV